MAHLQTWSFVEESRQKACRSRLIAVRRAFDASGIDAILVTRPCDIEYFTGFCGHDSWLLITRERAIVISDNRYDEQLNPLRETDFTEVTIGVRHRLHLALNDLLAAHRARRLGVQADHITVALRNTVAGAVEAAVVDTTGVVGALRRMKDALEIAAIERAIRINQDALRATLPQITLSMTERELSALLEYEMKRRGGDGAGFKPIVATGAHGSLPHYETTDAPIEDRAGLLIDWGTTADGYQSDLTRTFGINELPAALQEIYQVVLDAQLAAIDAIAPGKPCAAIDKVARDLITKAGYGDYFGHGLGHGLGKEVHEPPFFNHLETETLLAPGVVMTVEPGIYLPGVGGVRIEDNIVVTDSGCRVLSSFPKSLGDAVIAVE